MDLNYIIMLHFFVQILDIYSHIWLFLVISSAQIDQVKTRWIIDMQAWDQETDNKIPLRSSKLDEKEAEIEY